MSEEMDLQIFRDCVLVAWNTGKATLTTTGPGAARRVRQKYYRLRDKLTLEIERQFAHALIYKLNGCQLILIKPESIPEPETTIKQSLESHHETSEKLQPT